MILSLFSYTTLREEKKAEEEPTELTFDTWSKIAIIFFTVF